MFIMIKFGLHRFQEADNIFFSNKLYVTFGSVASSFGKLVFLREISISL